METTRSGTVRRTREAAKKTNAKRPASRLPARPKRPARPDAYSLFLEDQLSTLLDALKLARDGNLDVRIDVDGENHTADAVARAFIAWSSAATSSSVR